MKYIICFYNKKYEISSPKYYEESKFSFENTNSSFMNKNSYVIMNPFNQYLENKYINKYKYKCKYLEAVVSHFIAFLLHRYDIYVCFLK